jgi:O-antigen ligase
MNGASLPDRVAPVLRILVLVLLAAAPLALGSVHEPAFIPLLALSSLAGLASWGKAHWARVQGALVPKLPGRRVLLALHLLVLVQLLPLPPWLLRVLSPGSFAFYNDHLLAALTAWRPVSVSPADTQRGLAFLIGFTLLYGAVFREFGDGRWRRRLAATVVAVGLVLTVVGLVQARSGRPEIYGLWRPTFDWAVYGPYVNRNHFAGYLVMAIPLALGFALEALSGLRRAWRGRRVGWLALGGPDGSALVWRTTLAMALVVGLVGSESRGGFVACVLSLLALPLAARRRRQAVALVLLVGVLGVAWIGLDTLRLHFETRGIKGSRIDFWADMLPMVERFPLLGVGLNAFATAYPWYQTIWRRDWIGEAHNEYLQALLDTGILGAFLFGSLLLLLVRRAFAAASRASFELGLFGSVLALVLHNAVEFNWQIPANAATFVALAAVVLRRSFDLEPSPLRTAPADD